MRVVNGKRYLSPGETAKILGVSRQAVHYWIQRRATDAHLRKYIKVHQDSLNGYRYLEEAPILKLKRNFERRAH